MKNNEKPTNAHVELHEKITELIQQMEETDSPLRSQRLWRTVTQTEEFRQRDEHSYFLWRLAESEDIDHITEEGLEKSDRSVAQEKDLRNKIIEAAIERGWTILNNSDEAYTQFLTTEYGDALTIMVSDHHLTITLFYSGMY